MSALSLCCFFAILTSFPAVVVRDSVPEIRALYAEGETMGTTYHITYFDTKNRSFKTSIDSLLILVNKSISTYDHSSEVSCFNASEQGFRYVLPYFETPIKKALTVARESQGAFDPTILPLVNAWGFGPGSSLSLTKEKIDSLKQFVNYQFIELKTNGIRKRDPRIQLDFGGIGQGYGADVVADFLKHNGVNNFLVELGGEGVARGKNLEKNEYWRIGILDPNSTRENQFFKAYAFIRDHSFTTAGNYFNYKVIEGIKYGHTIDPRTGYPVSNSLLSVSVFTDDCATADAWDTAFLVAGVEKTIAMLHTHPELQALLIYSTPEGKTATYVTPGLKDFIVIEP
jgi:FAD:protein FMN transferase